MMKPEKCNRSLVFFQKCSSHVKVSGKVILPPPHSSVYFRESMLCSCCKTKTSKEICRLSADLLVIKGIYAHFWSISKFQEEKQLYFFSNVISQKKKFRSVLPPFLNSKKNVQVKQTTEGSLNLLIIY